MKYVREETYTIFLSLWRSSFSAVWSLLLRLAGLDTCASHWLPWCLPEYLQSRESGGNLKKSFWVQD